MALRDEKSDTSKTGPGNSYREQHMVDVDFRVGTLADEKRRDPRSVGTASDYRGSTDGYGDSTPGGGSLNEDPR